MDAREWRRMTGDRRDRIIKEHFEFSVGRTLSGWAKGDAAYSAADTVQALRALNAFVADRGNLSHIDLELDMLVHIPAVLRVANAEIRTLGAEAVWRLVSWGGGRAKKVLEASDSDGQRVDILGCLTFALSRETSLRKTAGALSGSSGRTASPPSRRRSRN